MPSLPETASLRVENVGGIESTRVEFTPGVSVLTGRNATNRTSLLNGLMAALGSESVSLKGDATEGRAALTIDGQTHTRTLTRTGETISFGGDPYLDGRDVAVADLFAFLLESNAARRAVAEGDDLRELIMRPVDTESIEDDVAALASERREIEARLDDLAALEADLTDLRTRRAELDAEIEPLESDLAAEREELDRAEADLAADGTLPEHVEELRDHQSELEEVRFELSAERDSLAAVRDELDEVETELASYPPAPDEELASIDAELDECRDRKQRLDADITELQRTIQFNERMVDGGDLAVARAPDAPSGDGDGTDEIVCWTCGSAVDSDDVERTVEQLRTLQAERREERSSVQERIDSLLDRRARLEESERRVESLERRREELVAELDERERRIESLERRLDELRSTVEEERAALETIAREEQSTTIERHREINRLEFELERLRSDRDDVVAEIETIEAEFDARDELSARVDEIDDEIRSLRGRVERVEENAVAEFNDHMSRVLDILDYDKLARIWIERKPVAAEATGENGLPESRFVLHIVRRTDDGTTYEDVIDHLSESEREVTGFVFALAGYLVHEVYDTVPFMLLDSMEAIDSERIARLVDYVRPYTDFLVVALLPEDAQALPDVHDRIHRN